LIKGFADPGCRDRPWLCRFCDSDWAKVAFLDRALEVRLLRSAQGTPGSRFPAAGIGDPDVALASPPAAKGSLQCRLAEFIQ